jgi:hypothetical protein
MLQWILPLEPHKRHQDIKSKRLNGTGRWFLETAEYEKWCNSDDSVDDGISPVLGCYGIPGAGKSVMRYVIGFPRLSELFMNEALESQANSRLFTINSSLVIDTLAEKLSGDHEICLVYIYCDYHDEAQQTAVNIIGTLIKQTLRTHFQHLPGEIFDSLSERKRKSGKAESGSFSLEEILQLFQSVLQHLSCTTYA